MAIQDLSNPTDAEVREYWDVFRHVRAAARDGWHAPYNNTHDDDGLGRAYELGFRDALDWLNRHGREAA